MLLATSKMHQLIINMFVKGMAQYAAPLTKMLLQYWYSGVCYNRIVATKEIGKLELKPAIAVTSECPENTVTS